MKKLALLGLSITAISFANMSFACNEGCYPLKFKDSGTVLMNYNFENNAPTCGAQSDSGSLTTGASNTICASDGTTFSVHDDSIPNNKLHGEIAGQGVEVHCGGTAPSGYCHSEPYSESDFE